MLTGLAKSIQSCDAPGCSKRALVLDQGSQWCPDHALELVQKKRARR